jgi:hypothetical protein
MSDQLRIGDRERTEAVDRLGAHAAAGRLDVEELERRVELAQRAVFTHDLATLEADLPSPRLPARRTTPAHPALALLVLALLVTVLVGHPVAPLFLVAFLLWRGGGRIRPWRVRRWSP